MKTIKKANNSKLKKGAEVNNAGYGPANTTMDGVFNFGGFGVAPLSQPWELNNSASYNLISLQYVMLSYCYVLYGPMRTLVDQPVYDAFRGGVRVKTDEVSPEELEALHREIKKLRLVKKVIEAMRWDRLYGGAGIIINTNQDYKKPLNLNAINEKSPLEFKSANRWELAWNGTPDDPRSTFTYYGLNINQSRVAKIVGEAPPAIVKQRLQGWGMSVIECVLREMNQYLKENNVIFELLDEAKIDVWKIKGFNAQVLSNIAKGVTTKRIQIAQYMKNFLNSVTLDAEDDYQQKTQTFTGLPEMLEQIRIGLAAAIRMPMAKIFGLASKGFASGEDDIENYNAIVENEREKAQEIFDVVIPVVCMKVWGFVPDDLSYDWKPLRVLSAEQEQNVITQKFNRLSTLYTQGILNPQEYCAALKQENVFTMETEVSKGADPQPNLGMMMQEDVPTDEGKKPSDGKSPTKEKD
ncbi:DUF1073 domain-containing protein [Candidatus Dependentiae bacterium]|nr:MAG: DUF1073 domain-containing protein [Candidatus Dependentiae bacterium]